MGRTQLNIRMREEQKEMWNEYVDQSRRYDSLTDFVKDAVRDKMERIDSGQQGGNFDIELADDVASGAGSGEVLERMQDLQNDFHDLQAEVGQAVDAVHAQSGVNPDVSPDVYQALPTGKEGGATAEELARTTGYKESSVRFALENMHRNMGAVQKVAPLDEEAGVAKEPRWYKSEGA